MRIVLLLLMLAMIGCTNNTPTRRLPKAISPIALKSADTISSITVATPPKPHPVEGEEIPAKSSSSISVKITKKIDLPPRLKFYTYTASGKTMSDKIHTFEFNSDLSAFTFIIDDRSTNISTKANYSIIGGWDGSLSQGVNIINAKVAQSTETPIDFIISMLDGTKVANIKLGENTFWLKGTAPPSNASNCTPVKSTPINRPVSHTVLYGESANRICAKYNITIADLIRLNPKLKSRPTGLIYPQETLIIK